MKLRFISAAAVLAFFFVYSCGPAAEDRKVMHNRAKIFQDSIAKLIRTSLSEAEGPAPQGPMPTTTIQVADTNKASLPKSSNKEGC